MATAVVDPLETQFETTAPEIRPFYVSKHSDDGATMLPTPAVETVIAPNDDKYPVEHVKQSKRTRKLMGGIDTFFSNPEHMGKLLPFIQQDPKNKPKLSIRLIEWFVCNYCMTSKVEWYLPESGNFFNVYLDYQEMMDNYRKQLFDPNARKWRKEKRKDPKTDKEFTVRVYHGLRFYYTDNDYVITTIAQLNFFRWFIEKNVLDYMSEHYKELSDEKNRFNKNKKAEKKHRGEAETEDHVKRTSKKVKAAKRTTTTTRRSSDDEDEPEMGLFDHPTTASGSWNGIPVRDAKRKIRLQATKKVTKQTVEVYVSFD